MPGKRTRRRRQRGRSFALGQTVRLAVSDGDDAAARQGRTHLLHAQRHPRLKRYLDEAKGMPFQDVWTDIEAVRSWHKEKEGYATQKPMALLPVRVSKKS